MKSAKKTEKPTKKTIVASKNARGKVSSERANRLYKLLTLIAEEKPVSRAQLVKKLKKGTRTFYRDIDLLRECGIEIQVHEQGYKLVGKLDDALFKLPFPDPELTFGDAKILAKGRTKSHAGLEQKFKKFSN